MCLTKKVPVMAGFDGVEIHGAQGYLIGHELVRDRNDLKVDGSIQYNECRFVICPCFTLLNLLSQSQNLLSKAFETGCITNF